MKIFLAATLALICSTGSAQHFYNNNPVAKYWVDSVYNSLTKQQRIAQLMVVRLSEKTPGGVNFRDAQVRSLIQQYNIGAICLFQGGPVQQVTLVNEFQKLAQTPLMICIDGETGLGMRMTDSVMKFPDQLTLGAVQDADLIYRVGKAIGEQCKRAGIAVNYAPVVDINNNPNNPVINFRSFGEDKYRVAALGTQIMKGMQDVGIMACAKHFPGHGDVAVDSHFDLPVINKSLAQLDSLELYPFQALFDAGIGSVMIAHLSIPSIDTTRHLPTSLSKKNVTTLLRDSLGFNGISFTDALEMQGVAKYYPGSDGSLQSLLAGNDMLCLPADIPGSIDKILKAIQKKKLDEADIEARVKKVLLAKYNLGLSIPAQVSTTGLTTDLNKAVPSLRKEVAENAITLLQLKDSLLLPIDTSKSIAYIAVGTNAPNTISAALKNNHKADVFYFSYADNSSRADQLIASIKGKYNTIIIGIHKYAKYPANNFGISSAAVQLVTRLQKQQHAITLVFGNPYAAKLFDDAPNLAACYEDDSIFQLAALDFIKGKFSPKGKLPVTISSGFHYGEGITEIKKPEILFPEDVCLSSEILEGIDSIANAAISKHAIPGCDVLIAREGKIVFNKTYGHLSYNDPAPVTTETVYDLASVTKIAATNLAVMKLYEEGRLDITKTLGDYLPWVRNTNKAGLRLENLLLHQAGLEAWIPFYKETIDAAGLWRTGFYQSFPDGLYSIPVADHMFMRNEWIDTMYKRILQSPLTSRGSYVYSDNDFIFLGKVVEEITGMPLNDFVEQTFYQPMQLASTGFLPLDRMDGDMIAPTEYERVFRLQLIHGYVHDPGAAMFGGVAGHAGLFSNAHDLAQLFLMLLNDGVWNGKRFLKKETIDLFTAYHSNISRRGYGFDKPEKDNATRKDPYPCPSASPATFGHTGFTGTCVWADPTKHLLFIFLSNRVNPNGGDNKLLSSLSVRGNIQELIYKAIMD